MNVFMFCMIIRGFTNAFQLRFTGGGGGGGGGERGGASRLVSYCLTSSSYQIKKHFDKILLVILPEEMRNFVIFKPTSIPVIKHTFKPTSVPAYIY